MEQTVYRLGAGDEVRISVFGLDALTNTYVVGDAGTISLPLVDEIPARGKTTQELEALIANNLRQRDVIKDPSVSAQVLKYRPFFILGEVQRPGQRSEEHTSELQSLMRISYAVFCLKKINTRNTTTSQRLHTTE